MVNQETSESLLDTLILQIFEEQEDAFSFPLTTMKETRDFVRLLNRQGFTYEMICAEIDEKFEAFRNWRLGGGPDSIGHRTMIRINKPLQEAMLSDGEDEDEETLRNGTTGDKASGGTRRKKSMDAGARARRSSKADSVDGEKKGKVKEEISGEGSTKKADPDKKGEVKGQASLETGKSEKTDTKDGRNKVSACDNHSKPSSPNVDAKLENAKVGEKRAETEKESATTAVATAKDATPNNVKINNDQLSSKAGSDTVVESSNKTTKQDNVVQATKKDASKALETSTDLKKKEQEAETGKKELATSTETVRKEQASSAGTDQKVLDRNAETKPKTTTEQEPKSPKSLGIGSQKLETEDKPESKKKDSKAEKKEQRTSIQNKTKEDDSVKKANAGSVKTPPTNKICSRLSGYNFEKSPENVTRSPDQATTSSTSSSKQDPSSPTSPSFKPSRPSSGCRQIPEVQTPPDTYNENRKKELATSTETVRKEQASSAGTDQRVLDRNTETKPKTTTEQEPKSLGNGSQKLETEDKPESKKKDSKAEKKEQGTSTENKIKEDERVEKANAGSLKTPPTNKICSRLSGYNLEKSPENVPSGSRQIPEVQTPSDKDKNTTDSSPKTKINTETPSKISETVSPTTKHPSSNTGAPSAGDQKSDSAKLDNKTAAQNNLTSDKQNNTLEAKILPDESKSSSTGQTDKIVPKTPEKETTVPSMLTAGNISRSKSEIIGSKIDETPKAPAHARTSSDNTDLLRPSATPDSPKPDLEATQVPPSEANQPTVDESYDSDLDSETVDYSAEDRALINRLRSLKQNQTKDGPGHLFVFSDTPAATGTGKHRVRVGNTRFPEKRLQQAQLFNPDIRMVTSVAVAMRKDALCQAQEELKSMSLRGKRGWYWGSLEVILKVITNLSVNKEDAIE